MESIVALEALIQENEKKIALQKQQLKNHEAGINKLSRMAIASSENALEISTELVEKYKKMLEKLQTIEGKELEEKEKLVFLAERKKYFDAQPSRIKLNVEQSNDKKLEVLRIIEELPIDVNFEDKELFEIATKSLELGLGDLNDISNKLEDIKSEFKAIKDQIDEKNIQELSTIDFFLPIVVLHFYVLSSNIIDNIEFDNERALQKKEALENEINEKREKFTTSLEEKEELLKEKQSEENSDKEEIKELESIIKSLNNELNKLKEIKIPEVKLKTFSGFPKYQDWWIRELWVSHQAYFALFKWKEIISNLCATTEQKKAWSIIFDRWVFIKKLLNDKGSLAYDYHYAFDSLMSTYGELEEELEIKNIESMEVIINQITKKEDFSKNVDFHNVNTSYLKFKMDKLKSKDKNSSSDMLF
ncbi:hypothetical protein Arnit_3017 [Arcobacter nitrofigilis DSM 7299]|uniref:Uncharacterized protein n=1 Tax=Arcobacter nitrofigilis (strain ATCC 33309 / DSM 7299 / CCUG 15893 / LMG 7604 / NCTC 12251 / CI) TaxID=572480 RepID=D5V7P5_ARCNC|nr:hypothetical protein [Arcobacter nitrofigilis]ADG94665.1 hypothetical protein Arnit_3017 [Arcobacter nitrofigilis DSM 7299]